MALTPLDIHHKEFGSARFGGYKEEEVDSFLDLVADEFERMIQENSETRQQIEQMKKRLQDFEEMQTTLQSALLAATKSAEAVKEQARQESEAMVAKAQEEVDSLIRSAQEQGRQMILRAQSEAQKIERENAKLREIKKRYLQAIEDLAQSHINQVNDFLQTEQEAEGETVLFPPEAQNVVTRTSPPEPAVTKPEPPPRVENPAPEAPPTVTREAQAAVSTPIVEESEHRIGFVAPKSTDTRNKTTVESKAQPEEPAAAAESAEVREERARAPRGYSSAEGMQAPAASVENTTRSSSNLVDEVLAMEGEEDLFAEFAKEEENGDRERKAKKPRKERRGEKHFFWE